jgi:hypothetical protein
MLSIIIGTSKVVAGHRNRLDASNYLRIEIAVCEE